MFKLILEETEMKEIKFIKKTAPLFDSVVINPILLMGGSWKSVSASWELLKGWEETQKNEMWNNQSPKFFNILTWICYRLIFNFLTELSCTYNQTE